MSGEHETRSLVLLRWKRAEWWTERDCRCPRVEQLGAEVERSRQCPQQSQDQPRGGNHSLLIPAVLFLLTYLISKTPKQIKVLKLKQSPLHFLSWGRESRLSQIIKIFLLPVWKVLLRKVRSNEDEIPSGNLSSVWPSDPPGITT